MNIKAQCCGLIFLIVIGYFYGRPKKLNTRAERAFFHFFYITTLSVSLDILSLAAITYHSHLPGWMLDAICKTYPVTLLLESLFGLLYVCVDVYEKHTDYRRFSIYYFCIACVGALLIYLLPIHYHFIGNDFSYTYGPSIYTTYLFALSLLACICVLIVRHRAKINPKRRQAVLIWMMTWIGASLIQLFNEDFLIVGYASCVGVTVIFLKLENPEQNIDRRTGLYNYSALMQYMRQFFNSEESFSLIMTAFDRSSNPVLYTAAGDALLLEVIKYLSGIPKALAFYTSDGILLMFPDKIAADAAISQIQKRFLSGWGTDQSIILNPGYFYIPDSRIADSEYDAMYLLRYARQTSKKLSADSFFLVDEQLSAQLIKEKEIEQLILESIEKDRVEVFYQPIFSTKAQAFTCAEALVRIRDRNGKIVPPGVFIDIAEQNGMILKLGEIVFEKVCQFINSNNLEKYGLHYIEINLSVVQCAYENLAESFIAIMNKYRINPKNINLEITESASLQAKKVLLDNMKKLLDYGISFSLDDFGTGQSNLNYIVDMPVQIVKFDRSMCNAYFENGKAKYVMDAAIHMLQGMHLEIVSEGIEDKDQYEAIEALGISYIQGYYFSKPLPANEFIPFVSASANG